MPQLSQHQEVRPVIISPCYQAKADAPVYSGEDEQVLTRSTPLASLTVLLPVVLRLPAHSFAHKTPSQVRHMKSLRNLFNFVQICSYALAQLCIQRGTIRATSPVESIKSLQTMSKEVLHFAEIAELLSCGEIKEG